MKVIGNDTKQKVLVTYVPHGINQNVFKPINIDDDFKLKVFNGKNYDFVLFWSNRNIKRKQPSDVIWAFRKFVDTLPEKDRSKVCLLMHTNPIDQNGTDLISVKEKICPDYDVLFSTNRLNQEDLNKLYNIADCTINIAGNEGFGLTTAESLMSGTPIIVAVTGGLQDQCGFRFKQSKKELTPEDYKKIGSLHDYRIWEDKVSHGEWVYPVWPRTQTMTGSVPTPYIIDDKVDIYEVADAIRYWYDMSRIERKSVGQMGREWMISSSGLSVDNMCEKMGDSINTAIENFIPKKRYNLYRVS